MRRLLLALASGILQFFAFPPIGWWWTAPIGVAALLLAVRGAAPGRAALVGLACGWAFFLPLLHWLTVLGWDAWLALALVIAGWYAGMGLALSVVADLRWWPLAVPVVWVLQEWLRSRFPWGGLGWGRLAFGQPDSPLTGWVSLGGAPLLTAAVRLGDEPQPDAVIWPENSADIDPVERPEARELVESAAVAIDAPILVGTVRSVPPDRAANVGLVWDPVAGPTDAYVKQHPVPFGEFLPLRPLLSRIITRFDRVPRDFIAGQEPGVLTVGPAVIADVICFEISNDEIVRTGVREGGRAVVVQTNNATYATTAQPEQQFDISRLRARETGREVLVAATTGVTAMITPTGEWTALPQLESGWINRDVSLRDSWTPAVQFGGLIDGVASLLGAVMIGIGLWGRRRRRAVER